MASLPHNSIRHDVQYKRPVATWPPMRVSLVCCSVVWYPRYSILIVDTYVTILVSPRSRYTAVYCSSTKYRETAQVSRVSTIPCSSYHLATCTLQACDAKTNSKVAENHNYHSTTMSAQAAVNKYNPISDAHTHDFDDCYSLWVDWVLRLANSKQHWNCTAHFRYRGSIEYRDTWDGIVIVAPISVIAQH